VSSYSPSENKYYAIISMSCLFLSCTKKDNRKRPIGFLKQRNKKTSIKIGEFKDLKWHDLKTELDDAICRASYLCKLDQKDLLPDEFKRGNSFGHTRPPRSSTQDYERLKNIPIGTQLGLL